jgi:hypothetical protein
LCTKCTNTCRKDGTLEEWENLPQSCTDLSWYALHKNPLAWLTAQVGATQARSTPPESILAEALSIWELSVSRWYGEQTPPVTPYAQKQCAEEFVWSVNPDEVDIIDNKETVAVRELVPRVYKYTRLPNKWNQIVAIAHSVVVECYPRTEKPTAYWVDGMAMVTWEFDTCDLTLVRNQKDHFISRESLTGNGVIESWSEEQWIHLVVSTLFDVA